MYSEEENENKLNKRRCFERRGGLVRQRERERKRAGNVLSSGEDRLHFCNVSTEFLMFVCSIVIC